MARLDVPFDPDESPFAQTWEAYVKAGYAPIPIMPRDKVPGEFKGPLDTGAWTTLAGWNDYSARPPHLSMYQRWKIWPNANIGVVLGGDYNGYQLVAIDFDTDDADEKSSRSKMIATWSCPTA